MASLLLSAVASITLAAADPTCPNLAKVADAAAVTAEQPPIAGWVVVLNAGTEGTGRWASFKADGATGCNASVLKILRSLKPRQTVDAATLQAFRDDSKALAKEAASRWVSAKGDQLDVFVFMDDGQTAKIDVVETPRKSRLETDFTSLFALGAKLVAVAGPTGDYTRKTYFLQRTRATLKASGTVGTGKDARSAEAQITTGPEERLFLSANLGYADSKQTTYDQDKGTLTPPKKPSSFYVGGNFSFSDLIDEGLSDTEEQSFDRLFKSIFIGGFVEGSKKPFSQVGAIAGTRYVPYLNKLVSFATVSPYAGVVWTRNDSLTAPTATNPQGTVENRYAERKWIFGVTVNLANALNWVGGSTSSQPTPKTPEK